MKNKALWITTLLAITVGGYVLPSTLAEDKEEKDRRKERLKKMEFEQKALKQELELIELFGEVAFNPEQAAMVAIGTISEELNLQDSEVIKWFEGLLGKAKSLGVRNAIRMSLKDLYQKTQQKDKLKKMLIEMVLENDRAIFENDEDDGDEEDEDDGDEEEEGDEDEEEE